MKRLLFLLALVPSVLFGAPALKDVKVPQLANVSPPTWPDVTISPAANSLLGFGSDKTIGNVTAGSGVTISGGAIAVSAGAGLPSQTGNSGKYLTTDGTTASWSLVPLTSGVSGILPGANGGSGVANTGKTITLGGNLTTSGAFALTVTLSATTGITLPTSGTLVGSADTGTVTNTMLAGSIANAKLSNSTVTIGSTAIALGAISTTLAGLTSVTSTTFIGALTGNASTSTLAATATALASGRTISITGDLAYTSPTFDGSGNVTAAGTLATVNSNVGSFGSATQSLTATVNGKGLITAMSAQTVTPAVGSITGLGTGVGTALAVNVGSAGAFVTFNGALGSPSSGTVTNLTGTASININGTVGATTPTTGVFTTVVAGSATSVLVGTAGSAVGSVGFRNATSGTATIAPPTGALGTYQVTLPNAASTLPIYGQQITYAGPTAARTVTYPDASFTVARTDAANTFTGTQTFSGPINVTYSTAALTITDSSGSNQANLYLVKGSNTLRLFNDGNNQFSTTSGDWYFNAGSNGTFNYRDGSSAIVLQVDTANKRIIGPTSSALNMLGASGQGVAIGSISGGTAISIAATTLNASFLSTTAATSTTAAGATFGGGIGVAGRVYVGTHIDAGGTIVGAQMGVGSGNSGAGMWNQWSYTGSTGTTAFGVSNTVSSNNTAHATQYDSNISTAAAAFTVANIWHYQARNNTLGAGSAVTTETGFFANTLNLGTTVYGFRGLVASGATKWNLYMDGTASNYLAGETLIGSNTDAGAYALQVTGAILGTTSVTTGAPNGGTAAAWKLGTVVTGVTSTFVTTSYLQVDVAGTLYKLALITSVP